MVTPQYSRDVYDEPDRHTKYPLNHFSRKNIEYLHSISYPEQEEFPRKEKIIVPVVRVKNTRSAVLVRMKLNRTK